MWGAGDNGAGGARGVSPALARHRNSQNNHTQMTELRLCRSYGKTSKKYPVATHCLFVCLFAKVTPAPPSGLRGGGGGVLWAASALKTAFKEPLKALADAWRARSRPETLQ